jgi:nitroimidazol reductase NimA-like FMN-containing flavoprotein (pyridoxamine 5'-phosphate oxidase superfamily)
MADQRAYNGAGDRLTVHECMNMMASARAGRVVYTRGALPAVELVPFVLYHGDIVIRPYDRLGVAMAANQVVAFEVDELDGRTWSGWSVTVVGQAREVTDATDLARLQAINVLATADQATCFIRITPGPISGRRFCLAR